MSAPSLASLDDFSDRVGGISTERETQAEAFLRAASAVVRAKAGRTWLDEDGNLLDVPEEVIIVVVEVAHRVWVNPDGVKREDIDSYSVVQADRAGFYVAADELELINGGPTAALASVRVEAPCFPTDSASLAWLLAGDEEELGE